jgi:tight adherence protein C
MNPATLNLTVLIPIAAFISIFLLLGGIISFYNQRQKRKAFIEKIKKNARDWEVFPDGASSPKRKKITSGILGLLANVGRRVDKESNKELPQISPRFLKAGLRNPNTPAIFLGVKSCLALLLPMAFFFTRIAVFEVFNATVTIAILLLLALLGRYLPELWLHVKTRIRKNRIFEGLPDALDLLVVCVEAGMGLDSAINRVGQELELSNKTLSDEFKLLNLELRAGKSRKDALKNLAIRTDLEEVNNLVTLLIQTDKFGTSVARTLRVYSDTFRTKRFQKAEEKAAKLPVKIVIPLILFIFPSLFIVLMGPAAIRLFEVLASR